MAAVFDLFPIPGFPLHPVLNAPSVVLTLLLLLNEFLKSPKGLLVMLKIKEKV